MTSQNSLSTHPDDATLSAYYDKEIRGFAYTEVEEHVAACPACRQSLARFEGLDTILRGLSEVEAPSEVRTAVMARLDTMRRPLHWRRWGVAAIVAVLGTLLFGTTHMEQPLISTALNAVPNSGYDVQRPVGSASISMPQASVPQASNLHSAPIGIAPSHPSVGRTVPAPPLSLDARLIERNADVNLRVPNVQNAFNAVSEVAVQRGGYVSSSNNNSSVTPGGGYAAILTLRVPAVNFQSAMTALGHVPHAVLLSEHTSSADVTDRYHDLQARLQALQATRAQLMAVMRKAGGIPDALQVLSHLTDINTQIDSTQGQIMANSNLVMFSTITVNLEQVSKSPVVVPSRPKGEDWRPLQDVSTALSNLWLAIRATITVGIYAVIYAAIPCTVIVTVLRLWRRHGTPRAAV